MNGDNPQMRGILIGAAVLVVLVSVVLLLASLWGLKWYLSPDNSLSIVQRRDLVQGLASAGQALAVFLTGAVGLIGLFFTWQNTSQARASTLRTLQLTEQGQITERFTRAVDQLGAREGGEKNMEMRIGGLYALERISRESQKDYWPIMELLSSYVREHAAPQPTIDSDAEDSNAEDPNAEDPNAEDSNAEDSNAEDSNAEDTDADEQRLAEIRFSHRSPDIQAAISVIGRRSRFYWEEPRRIVLDHTDLSSAWLLEANLTGMFLWRANARRINAEDANFQKAALWFADLTNSYLVNANFTEANLERANLERANLTGANFAEANLASANLTGALGLNQSQINVANGDETTILPDGLTRPAHWMTHA